MRPSSPGSRLRGALAALFMLAGVAPGPLPAAAVPEAPRQLASLSEAPRAPASPRGPTRLAAEPLFRALRLALSRAVEVASRSDRIDLRLDRSFLDAGASMGFDLGGTVRVRVPAGPARRWLDARLEAGESDVFSTNGPISLDIAVTPLERTGDEFTLGVHLDISVVTVALFVRLVAKAGGAAGVFLAQDLADQAARALAVIDPEALGEALALGVEELPGLFGGLGSAVAYIAFQVGKGKPWVERLRATLSPGGFVKHFALALVLTGVARGASELGTTVGAAVAASLFPGGAPFVLTALATKASVWFGVTAVKVVALKVPVWWRLSKLGRLYRRATEGRGERQRRASARYAAYLEKVTARALAQMDQAFVSWDELKTVINWFRFHVKYRRTRDPFGGLDLVAYQPFLDAVARRLAHMATHGGSWYAARLFYQLKDAVNQLDDLGPDAPEPRGAWRSVVGPRPASGEGAGDVGE